MSPRLLGIGKDTIRKFLDKGNDWAIVSSRSEQRSREAIPSGFGCETVVVCRVDMRAEELIQLRRTVKAENPNKYDKFLYVADRQSDGDEAKLACWFFCLARNFARYVELMS